MEITAVGRRKRRFGALALFWGGRLARQVASHYVSLRGGPLRALILNDDLRGRAHLQGGLEALGYEVVVASTEAAALLAHRSCRCTIVFVAADLPGAGAAVACEHFRATSVHLPIVVTTKSVLDRAALTELFTAGAQDFLLGDVSLDELRLRLDKSEAERQAGLERDASMALADRMASVGTLAAGVAHELNNPLAYLLSNLRILREEPERARAETNELLDEALHGAERMRMIIRDLKTFSTVDDERRELVDIAPVAESALNMCWNQLRHRAELETQFEPAPKIEVNPARLAQVFVNLIVNAVQALPEERAANNRVTVAIRTGAEGEAECVIRDNGCGIEPAIQGRIFEPFFSTRSVADGAGLGLSVCHNIVHGAGGQISLTSHPGEGAEFVLRFPPARMKGRARSASSRPPPATGPRSTILIIDDEPMVARALKRVLRGHDVTVVSSGRDAVSLLRREGDRFDLIFCDVMMPEVSGMDVYEQIAADNPSLEERMVFMTGGAFSRRAQEFLASVPNECLEKPFDLSSVRELVESSGPTRA